MVIGAVLLAATLLQPTVAAGQSTSNIGFGAYAGSINYTNPVPRAVNSASPTVTEPCVPTTFTISGSTPVSATFVFNTALTGHLGTLNWSGTGSSTCETALGGAGAITLTNVQGVGPTNSKIDCANPSKVPATTLTGGYTRTATDFEAVLGGRCIINGPPGFDAAVLFSLRGEWEPEPGTGVTTSTTKASIQGVILVQPA